MSMLYHVIARTDLGNRTIHSTWESQEEAQDQADLVDGEVVRVFTDWDRYVRYLVGEEED